MQRRGGSKGKRALSLRALKSTKQRNHPHPKLHHPRVENASIIKSGWRNFKYAWARGRKQANGKATQAREQQRRRESRRRFINITAFHRLRGCGLQTTFTTQTHKNLYFNRTWLGMSPADSGHLLQKSPSLLLFSVQLTYWGFCIPHPALLMLLLWNLAAPLLYYLLTAARLETYMERCQASHRWESWMVSTPVFHLNILHGCVHRDLFPK